MGINLALDDVLKAARASARLQGITPCAVISGLARESLRLSATDSSDDERERSGLPLLPIRTSDAFVDLELVNQLPDRSALDSLLALIIRPDQSTKRLPSARLVALRRAGWRVYSLAVGLAAVGSTWAACSQSSRGAQCTVCSSAMYGSHGTKAAAAFRAEHLLKPFVAQHKHRVGIEDQPRLRGRDAALP